ncbi:MAG: spermidine/putrescine ABC transporter substrate-binding protein [Nocardioides sp.]
MAAPLPLTRRGVLRWGAGLGVAVTVESALAGCATTAADTRISFLNWQDYVDPEILTRFTEETGLQVGYETYESNDELERRLTAASVTRKGGRKASSFDLIVPSDNVMSRLRGGNALQRLDSGIVTAALLDNLDPRFRDLPVDPGNAYSIPWAYGTTGIGYDRTVFSEPPTWEVFADEQYSGRVSLLKETREAFAAALLSLGEDPNTTDAAVIGRAETVLETWLQQAELNAATYLDDLAEGRLVAAQGFNTDVLQAQKRNSNLAFTIPEQGGTLWTDLLCIPVDAPNPEGANKLVAFYLDPEISAMNATFNRVATGNAEARGSSIRRCSTIRACTRRRGCSSNSW